MRNLKEIGHRGHLIEEEESERDYLKKYTHQQETILTSAQNQGTNGTVHIKRSPDLPIKTAVKAPSEPRRILRKRGANS